MLGHKTLLVIGSLMILTVICVVGFSRNVAKSYHHLSIVADIVVHKDTTLTVSETMTQEFHGSFHRSLRYIPLNQITTIDGVSVIDGTTNQALLYSPTVLDKMDPKSWGKYTTYIQGKDYLIEWYYDVRDTTHSWTLTYNVHGGIDLYQDYAELKWNLFTRYHVPVDALSALIHLPAPVATSTLSIFASSEEGTMPGHIIDGATLGVSKIIVPAKGPFTIIASFPKTFFEQVQAVKKTTN